MAPSELDMLRRRQRLWSAVSRHPCATTRELAVMVGFKSTNTVMHYLRFLRAAGYIAYEDRAEHARRIIIPCGVAR